MDKNHTLEALKYGATALLLALAYVALAHFGLMLDAIGGFATLVWPPTALSLAALLLLGNRYWPSIALGAFVANRLVGASLPAAIGITCGNTLEAVLGAYALRQLGGFQTSLGRTRDVLGLIGLAGVASTMVSATFGVTSLMLFGPIARANFRELWCAWWLGDLSADLILAPAILVWSSWRPKKVRLVRVLEIAALSVSTIAVNDIVFSKSGSYGFGRVYMLYPVLIWAALRFRTPGAVTATLVSAVTAVYFTTLGNGPFVRTSLVEGLFALQAFMAITGATFLILGAATSERVAAAVKLEAGYAGLALRVEERTAELRRAHAELDQRVRARTLELASSEARKAAVLEAAFDCIITIDHQGKILEFNPAAEKTFGYTRKDVIGKELASLLIPEEMRAAHRGGLRHYLEYGNGPLVGKRLEFHALRSDGTLFPVELAIAAISGDGLPVFIGYVRDVTEARRIEEERARLVMELEEAVRARDALISIASHELRTPLAALQLQVDILKRSERSLQTPQDAPPSKAAKIGRQVQRLNKLIDNLLDVSRITAGKLQLELEDVDLAALVGEVVQRFEEEAQRAHSPLIVQADAPVIGRWDRMRLEQIATNLVSNALKYGRGRPVDICVEGEGAIGRLTVRDRGIGIAAEDQQRIFERFERLSLPKHTGGLGLGLWIVHQIVDALGGKVKVESAPGAGATFVVELPGRKQTQADAPSIDVLETTVSTAPRPGALKVLVVEDDPDIMEAIGEVIRSHGYEAVCVTNGQEAIDYLRSGARPQVVLLDLMMPIMNGWQFLDVRRQNPDFASIPIVLLSADGQLADKARSLDVQGYIQKPVNMDRLLLTLEQHRHP